MKSDPMLPELSSVNSTFGSTVPPVWVSGDWSIVVIWANAGCVERLAANPTARRRVIRTARLRFMAAPWGALERPHHGLNDGYGVARSDGPRRDAIVDGGRGRVRVGRPGLVGPFEGERPRGEGRSAGVGHAAARSR